MIGRRSRGIRKISGIWRDNRVSSPIGIIIRTIMVDGLRLGVIDFQDALIGPAT